MADINTPARLENETSLSHQPTELPKKGLLRFSQFKPFVGISKTTVWDWSTCGKFPSPIKLSSNVTVWRASDIHTWLASHGEV